MTVSILLGTYGHTRWSHQARMKAFPSTIGQRAHEVLMRHEVEGTVASVRNALAEQATGDWLCFLDADDQLAPDYLFWMAQYAQANCLLVPAVQFVSHGKLSGVTQIPNGGDEPGAAERMIDVNCAVIGTLVPRKLFLEVGGFDEEPIYEDWALWLRCMIAGAKLVQVPGAVYIANQNGERNQFTPEAVDAYREIQERLGPAWRAACTTG